MSSKEEVIANRLSIIFGGHLMAPVDAWEFLLAKTLVVQYGGN